MSFFTEHWEAFASLLLSVVAIAIAIYSSRRTAKDATEQIEKIKDLTQQTIENTTKHVESIKELAKMQIEVIALELDKEMAKNFVQTQKADEESKEIRSILDNNQIDIRNIAIQKYQSEQPIRDLKYHNKYLQLLGDISNRLDQLKS